MMVNISTPVRDICLLTLFWTLSLSAHGNTDSCSLSKLTTRNQIAHKKSSQDYLISYRGENLKFHFPFIEGKGHRSRPGDIVEIDRNQLLVAWGDMGLVIYSREYKQVVDTISLERLTRRDFNGEVLSLERYRDNSFRITVFDNSDLKYKSIRFSLNPLSLTHQSPCPKLPKISSR